MLVLEAILGVLNTKSAFFRDIYMRFNDRATKKGVIMEMKWKVEIAKAFIGAIIPTVLGTVLKRKKPVAEKKQPIVLNLYPDNGVADLIDNVDWDAEYEKLLEEEKAR